MGNNVRADVVDRATTIPPSALRVTSRPPSPPARSSRRPAGGAGRSQAPAPSKGPALTLSAAVLGGALTLLALGPLVPLGFRNASAHVAIDSVDACVALLVAALAQVRFRRDQCWQHLLLAQAMLVLALAGPVGQGLAHLGPPTPPGATEVWLPLTLRAVASLLLVAGAIVGLRATSALARRRHQRALPLLAVGALTLALVAAARVLPVAVPGVADPSRPPGLLSAHPAAMTIQGLGVGAMALAAVLFALQSSRRADDDLLVWLGPACAFAALARLSYLLYPTLYSDWLYTGDLLRSLSYLALLAAGLRELGRYWAAQAELAVLRDRQRLARELHDGVVQELGFIRGEAHRLAAPTARRILAACDRGLDEARAAVQALGAADREALGTGLARVAGDLAARHGVPVEVRADDELWCAPEVQHAVLRIVREAVGNAARHGAPTRIVVCLSVIAGRRRVEVWDDGAGFDVAADRTEHPGYGLVSMRERAEGLPGRLQVTSTVGRGTAVELTW